MSERYSARGNPPFQEHARCVKCGSEDVSCTYHANGHAYGCRAHSERWEPKCCHDEHFDRHCRRCHYTWREEVLADG